MTTVALTFINENGKKYQVVTDKIREDATLDSLGDFMNGITQIGASGPDGTDHWIGTAAPRFVEKRAKRPRKSPKPSEVTKPRTPTKKYWLISPTRIINSQATSVIKTLKKFFAEGGDPEVFVSSLWLVKHFWHAKVLTLTQRIEPKDFYFELKEIFDIRKEWTQQMLEALPQLSFIFSKEEWARLHKEWSARRNALKKEMQELQEHRAQKEPTADDILRQIAADLEADPPIASMVPGESKTKVRPSKKVRNKLKKFKQSGGKVKKVSVTETILFNQDEPL